MSSGGPWSVKGIDPRARARAKTAARREGVTLGEWLNRVLLDDSASSNPQWDDALAAFPGFGGSAATNDEEDRLLRSMINTLGERLESSEALSSKALAGLDTAFTQMSEKLAENEARSKTGLNDAQKIVDTIRKDHDTLSSRIETLEDAPSVSSADFGLSAETTKAIETTMAKLASRLYDTEKDIAARLNEADHRSRDIVDDTRKTTGALENRIVRMETRADDFGELTKRRDQRTSEAMTGLHQVTDSLRQRVESVERNTLDASRVLDGSLGRLDDRLRTIETRNSSDNVELERRFDRMSDDVASIIADTRSNVTNALNGTASDHRVDQLENAITQALHRMDDADRRQGDNLSRLGDEITRLANAIDKRLSDSEQRAKEASRDTRTEQALDRRLDAVRQENKTSMRRMGEEVARLGHSLADRIARSEEKSTNMVNSVTEKMTEAVERIEHAHGTRENDLDDRLKLSEERTAAQIVDAMDTVHERLSSVRSDTEEAMTPVQRALSALADRLEAIETRDDTKSEKTETAEKSPDAASAKPKEIIDFDTPLAPPPQAETPVSTFEANEADPFLAKGPVNASPTTPLAGPVLRTPPQTQTPAPAVTPQNTSTTRQEPPQTTQTPPPIRPKTPKRAPSRVGATADADFLASARERTRTYNQNVDYERQKPSSNNGRIWMGLSLIGTLIAIGTLSYIVFFEGNDTFFTAEETATSNSLVVQLKDEFAASQNTETNPQDFVEESIPAPQSETNQANENPTATANGNFSDLEANLPDVPDNIVADADNSFTPTPPAASPERSTRPTSRSSAITVEEAATDGNPVARYLLGLQRLEVGDYSGASILLRRAAEQGIPAAQYRYAKQLITGEGVEINLEDARQWIERAANSGHRLAMHELGIMYFYGTGTAQNNETAARWFEEAALLGLADSQFNLARLYEEGQGVPLSLADAYAWYAIVGASGDQDASNRAADLIERMPPQALSEAQGIAARFQARPLDQEANGIYRNRPWNPYTSADSELTHRAQGFLSVLGYGPGPIDGMMGDRTLQAILNFQSDQGLERTGIVDEALLERLQRAATG